MLIWCDASYVTFSRVGVGWHRRYNDAVWAEWCIRICNTAARTRRGTRQRRSHVWEVTGETRMVWLLVQHDTLTCVSSNPLWKHRGWGRGTGRNSVSLSGPTWYSLFLFQHWLLTLQVQSIGHEDDILRFEMSHLRPGCGCWRLHCFFPRI